MAYPDVRRDLNPHRPHLKEGEGLGYKSESATHLGCVFFVTNNFIHSFLPFFI